jgi:DNA-binding CsgD family transcriptional regulator
MLSMADGNRALAEEVARTTVLRDPAATVQDRMALLRGVWLLLRLEWFHAALRQVKAFRSHGDLNGEQETLADALEAYAYAATGPTDRAIALGRRTLGGSGLGVLLGASVAARVLTRCGRYEEAHEVVASAPPPRRPADIGATSLLIARGTLAAQDGRPTEALNNLRTAGDHLRRVGSRNPAGWPLLEPTVHALVQLGQRSHAAAFLATGHEDACRWGTPVVVAEVHRATARAGASPKDVLAARAAAVAVLAGTEAQLEHEWALRDLEAEGGNAGRGTAATATEPLAALTPRVREVALMVAEGLRDREIAQQLHLSPRTVHRHVATALETTGARNRVDLARIVHREPPFSARVPR